MRRTKEAAARAKDRLPRGDGREGLGTLRWLCAELAGIYWSHSKGSGRPLKVVKHWVERVVAIVDPEVTESNINPAWQEVGKPPSK